MRRFISAIMILCLLQVTTLGAVSAIPLGLTSIGSNTATISAEHQHPATAYVAIPGDDTAQHDPSLTERLTVTANQFCAWVKAKSQTKAAHVIIVPSAFAASVCLIFCLKLFATMYEGGAPLDASYGYLMHGTPTTFAASDICVQQHLDYSSYIRNRYSHTTNTNDAFTLPQAVHTWLSNAGHVLGVIVSASMNARHADLNHSDYAAFRSAVYTLLHNNGIDAVRTPVSCTIDLGNGVTSPQVLECEDGLTSDTLNGQATLQLYSPSGKHNRYTLKRDSIYLHVPDITMSQELRYPASEFSWDYGSVNRAMVVDSRRMLLQTSNTLALPDAIKHWLSNADHWLTLAGETATLLHHGKCPSTQQANELNTLTQAVFEANQALFAKGAVRCDLDHADNVSVFNCTHDTEPKDYDHTANCPDVQTNVERDAAIWLVPYTGKSTYSTFLLSVNPILATPAPTTPMPTPAPTPAPKVVTQTRALQETASKTLEPTHSPTLPHTITPPRPHTVTPPVPVKNTTTRLYWSNLDNNEIWVADVDLVNLKPINPRIFLRNIPNPKSIIIDERYKKLYWSSPLKENIMVADIYNISGTPFINNTREFVPNSNAMYLDHATNTFYFQPNPNVLPTRISYFSIDRDNPTYKIYYNNYSYYPAATSSGLTSNFVVRESFLEVYARCDFDVCLSQINASTRYIEKEVKLTNMSKSNAPKVSSTYPVAIALDTTNGLLYWRDQLQSIYVVPYVPGTKVSIKNPTLFINTSLYGVYGGLSLVCVP